MMESCSLIARERAGSNGFDGCDAHLQVAVDDTCSVQLLQSSSQLDDQLSSILLAIMSALLDAVEQLQAGMRRWRDHA